MGYRLNTQFRMNSCYVLWPIPFVLTPETVQRLCFLVQSQFLNDVQCVLFCEWARTVLQPYVVVVVEVDLELAIFVVYVVVLQVVAAAAV